MEKGSIQGMWKRFRRDGETTTSYNITVPETDSKRKGMTPTKEVQKEMETEKRSKKEEEVVLLGHLMARHLGSVEAAAQPCRHQGVLWLGTVGGLGTGVQFKSLSILYKYKILRLCFYRKHGHLRNI